MPTVLITGINGFVATHIVLKFLTEGWDVRGTVRSTLKGDETLSLSCFDKYKSQLSYVVLEDLVEGDYSAALQGADAVAHCASPWNFEGKSWDFYRRPAVEGTLNILRQAAKIPSIKAVVLISSCGAILECKRPFSDFKGKTYTEDDWSPHTEQECEQEVDNGDGQAQTFWYCVGKIMAERAAVKTWEDLGSPCRLVVLCPPMIYGPALNHKTRDTLPTGDVSTGLMFATLAAGKEATVPPSVFPWVDARDVAEAFFQSVQKQVSGRFIIAAGVTDYDMIAAVAVKLRPDLQAAGKIPSHLTEGNPLSKGCYKIDTTKAQRELGITFRTMQDMVRDVIDSFEKLGAYSSSE